MKFYFKIRYCNWVFGVVYLRMEKMIDCGLMLDKYKLKRFRQERGNVDAWQNLSPDDYIEEGKAKCKECRINPVAKLLRIGNPEKCVIDL